MGRFCDARCRAARGQRCECWCGGRYHGHGFAGLARMAEDFGLGDPAELGERFTLRDPRGAAGARPERPARRPRLRAPRLPSTAQLELPLEAQR